MSLLLLGVSAQNTIPFASNFITAANITNTGLQTAIQDFFTAIGSSAYKCEYIYLDVTDLTAGTNAQRLDQGKLNAVNPLNTDAAFRQIYTNAPTMNTNGMTFNGTTQFSDTRCNPSTAGKISLNKTTLIRAHKSNINFRIGGGCWDGSAVALWLSPNYASGYPLSGINAGSNTNGVSSNNVLATAYRISSIQQVCRFNNALNAVEGRASVSIPNFNIYRGAVNSPIGADYYEDCRHSGEILGAFEDIAEISKVEIALNNFNIAVETNFSLGSGVRSNF